MNDLLAKLKFEYLMKRIFFIYLLFFGCSDFVFAQKTRTVNTSAFCVVPKNMTSAEAKKNAMEAAINKAIADCDFNGEWIETMGEPEYSFDYIDNQYIVIVNVSGKIKEILQKKAVIDAKVLCNGTSEKDEKYIFNHNDVFFVKFKSSENGYLSIFLVDYTNGIVQRILPYIEDTDSTYRVEKETSHIYFSKDYASKDKQKYLGTEYRFMCELEEEKNDMIFIFSNEPFSSPVGSPEGTIYIEDFRKWMDNINKKKDFTVETKNITIKRIDLIPVNI